MLGAGGKSGVFGRKFGVRVFELSGSTEPEKHKIKSKLSLSR